MVLKTVLDSQILFIVLPLCPDQENKQQQQKEDKLIEKNVPTINSKPEIALDGGKIDSSSCSDSYGRAISMCRTASFGKSVPASVFLSVTIERTNPRRFSENLSKDVPGARPRRHNSASRREMSLKKLLLRETALAYDNYR